MKNKNLNNIKTIQIKNNKNLCLTLCNYGASIYKVTYKSKLINCVSKRFNDFLFNTNCNFGKSIGPVCGRIKNGEFKSGRKNYLLEKNENNNTLHSGKHAIQFQTFSFIKKESKNFINVIFNYKSQKNECGFPGYIIYKITYSLNKNKDEFKINYFVTPSKTVPLNLTNHTYWQLGDKDILNHKLKINADEVTVINQKDLTIIGKEKVNKLFDFRKGKLIGEDLHKIADANEIINGYDHGFIFNKKIGQIELSFNKIKLKIITDTSMVNIYTNCHSSQCELLEKGKDKLYSSVAIEPENYFCSYKDILYSPKKPLKHYIKFNFKEN